jgi:hypothetical protein
MQRIKEIGKMTKKELLETLKDQNEYILDLEFRLNELTGKFEYLEEELYDMQIQKEKEKLCS